MAQRLAVVAGGNRRGIWMRLASSAPVRGRGIGAAGAARVAMWPLSKIDGLQRPAGSWVGAAGGPY